MARISIDNGFSYCSVVEALLGEPWAVIVHYMDDDTRELVHRELAPCTEAEFLSRYLELAPDDLIIG